MQYATTDVWARPSETEKKPPRVTPHAGMIAQAPPPATGRLTTPTPQPTSVCGAPSIVPFLKQLHPPHASEPLTNAQLAAPFTLSYTPPSTAA